MTPEKKGLLHTVTRAMDLLNCFTYDNPEWTLTALSRKLGQPKSVVFRLLSTLKEGDFISQDPRTKRYRLGTAIYFLGAVAESQMVLRKQAYEVMRNLADLTMETVILSLLDNHGSVCIEMIESPHRVKVMAEIGRRLDLYAGAPHKTLLAYYPEEDLDLALPETLESYGPNSIVDHNLLISQLAEIRAQGFAISQEERSPGVGSVSAPVRDKTSRVIASLSLAIPLNRFTDERMPELIDQVREHAGQVSAKMGYRI